MLQLFCDLPNSRQLRRHVISHKWIITDVLPFGLADLLFTAPPSTSGAARQHRENRHPLVLQIGHVAIDGPLRHLQPLGQKFSRAQTPAAYQLDKMEEAVGAAHGGGMV